jgi:DNA recombination protein RmuC
MRDVVILFWLAGGLVAGCVVTWLLGRARIGAAIAAVRKDATTERAVLQERLSAREQEAAALTGRLAEVQGVASQAADELTAARMRIAGLKEQVGRMPLLEKEIATRDERLRLLQADHARLGATVSELETRLDAERRQADEKLALLGEAKEQLRLEFQNLANRIFEDKSRRFTDQNRLHLDQVLNPFREQLQFFGQKVDDVYQKEARERFSLRQEVLRLQQLNQQISADAVNLTNALKGQVKTQGTWGEIILERVLEESGLTRGREYVAQGSFRNAEGRQLRPDVVVHLPEGKDIVIDSKVSLVAYERYVNAADAAEREQACRQHLASLRAHLKSLASKSYEDLPGIGSLDFVLMFVPVEGAFLLALEEDGELFRKAFERNIMLVSPSTLLVTLRTIQNIWRYEYQNRNALEIARRAGALYDQFVRFIEDLEKLGEHLLRSQQCYDSAHKRLATGRGNLVRRVQGLRELGVKSKKSLAATLLESAEAVPDEDEPQRPAASRATDDSGRPRG